MTDVSLSSPEYKIEEEDEDIIITISAPLSKPREAALVLEKDVFTFDSNPYLLIIKLPHPVSDKCKGLVYDDATWTYKIRLQKVPATFENESEDDDDENIINGAVDCSSLLRMDEPKSFYGFANRHSNIFGKLYDQFSEVVNLPNPDETDVKDRRKLRLEEENEKWSEDHYLADMMETDHLESIFKYKPPWVGIQVEVSLTDYENEMLTKINKKAVKNTDLSEKEKKIAEFQIVDVLFGYAYNRRTTEGENTVESGWTINKLSSTLSWFEEFEDLKTLLLTCYRRALIYPLYRNWTLNKMVHKDIVDILKLGPKGVARCLIEVIEIFNDSEDRYLLNTLYVNNLCSYSVNMTDERLQELALEVEKVNITKYEVNRDLPLIEIAAHLTLEEEMGRGESEVSNIIDKITSLNLETETDSDEPLSSDSDESDGEESDEEESDGNESVGNKTVSHDSDSSESSSYVSARNESDSNESNPTQSSDKEN